MSEEAEVRVMWKRKWGTCGRGSEGYVEEGEGSYYIGLRKNSFPCSTRLSSLLTSQESA